MGAEILLIIFSLDATVSRMSEKTLTSRQVAERYKVALSTARAWFLQGLVPDAPLKQTELGPVWIVSESALNGFVPPRAGRPPKGRPVNGTEATTMKTAKEAILKTESKKKAGKR